MAKRVIGLDVGTYSVKVAHLEARTRETDFDLLTYKEVLLSKFANSELEKTELDLQQEAIAELKSQGDLDGSWIATGLPSSDAQIRSLEVPFSNRKKIEAVLPGLMDSHLPFAVDNLIYSWHITEEKESASRLLVSFARKEAIAGFLGNLRKSEVDPRYLTLKSAALYDLMLQLLPAEGADSSLYCVVDIGHKSTSICIGDKKTVRFARSVPKGGYHVTQNLALKMGISIDEAEQHKLSAKEMGDLLREAYYPIARELKQTILAMEAETHTKLEQVYLVGGASKAAGLSEFLSSLLKAPVQFIERFAQFNPTSASRVKSRASAEAGLALSYAVLSERASHRESRFNFRKDEFSFSGEFDYMRQRVKAIVAWSCVILFLFAMSGSIRNFFLAGRLEKLSETQTQMCQQITGNPMDGATCLLAINAEIGQLKIPLWSSTDVYLELSNVIPSSIPVKVTNLDITSDLKIKMTIQSENLSADQDVVNALNRSGCFKNADKSGKKQIPAGIQFTVNTQFDCEKDKDKDSTPTSSKPKEA